MIDFKDVSKHYGARDIFNNASFRVEKGERVGVVGPNGSGKSTLFAMITGEDRSPASAARLFPQR